MPDILLNTKPKELELDAIEQPKRSSVGGRTEKKCSQKERFVRNLHRKQTRIECTAQTAPNRSATYCRGPYRMQPRDFVVGASSLPRPEAADFDTSRIACFSEKPEQARKQLLSGKKMVLRRMQEAPTLSVC